uniref:Uncharacterized protein n=1 Tax=Setaria italica TaxID=4555 RepID=K4AK10_SETIT
MELCYPQLLVHYGSHNGTSSMTRSTTSPHHHITRFLPTSDQLISIACLMCSLPIWLQLWHALFASGALVPFKLWISHHEMICSKTTGRFRFRSQETGE